MITLVRIYILQGVLHCFVLHFNCTFVHVHFHVKYFFIVKNVRRGQWNEGKMKRFLEVEILLI